MPTKRIEVDYDNTIHRCVSRILITGLDQWGGYNAVWEYHNGSPREGWTNSDNATYFLNSKLGDSIPENSKIKKINFNFYVKEAGRRGNSSQIFILSLTGDRKETAKFETSHFTINGWNSVPLTSNNPEIFNLVNGISVMFGEYIPGTKTEPHVIDRFRGPVYTEIYTRGHYLITANSKDNTYKPYVEVEYEYNKPLSPDSLLPTDTTLNPKTPIRFSWNSKINQSAFELQYKVNSGSWKTVQRNTTDRFYELPQGTITESNGTVSWKVRVKEESGVYSEWVSSTFNIGATVQPIPRLVRPVGDYIEAGKAITFDWQFVPSATEEQRGYELSYNKGNGWVTLSETTSNEYTTRDLKISDSKVVYWKLRVKNQFNEWSEWTEEASFQVVGKPTAPQITEVSNTNRPTVKWTSKDQELYELEIVKDEKVIYRSGKVLSVNARQHKVTEDIPNGKYIVKLKIANNYNIESPTTEFTKIINPKALDTPTLNIFVSDFFLNLVSDAKSGTVIRNGKEIGQLENGSFKDYSCVNKKYYTYKIRTSKNDVFADSKEVASKVDFKYNNTLARIDKLSDYIKLRFNVDSMPKKSIENRVSATAIELEGLAYPVFEFSEHRNESISCQFFLQKKKDLDKLKALVKSCTELLYRDCRGENYQGVITSLGYDHHELGYSVSFTITRTDDFYD